MPKYWHPGAYPSPVDYRDWLHRVVSNTSLNDIPLEGGVDEVPLIIHNQGKLPICTGEAGAYLQMINQYFETGQMTDFSSMFIYKMNKEIDKLPPDIKGSTVKATVETLRLKGVCREILYPSNRLTYLKKTPSGPSLKRILEDAYPNRIIAYTRCLNLNDILIALAEKKPVIFSIYLLENFYKSRGGRVPSKVAGKNVGGHAMVALKYNREEKWVKVVQSWGKGPLTDGGYMYIPFTWFTTKIKENFPVLMEAYTVLDYIPQQVKTNSGKITVEKLPITIEVNGQTVKDINIPPLLINELGFPLVTPNVLEQVFASIVRQSVQVTWDPDNRVIKINI